MAENTQSWVSLYVCLVLSIVLIILRLFLRRLRVQSLTSGDYWCIATVVFILARLIANHYLLVYGSTRLLSEAKRIELLDGNHEAALFRVTMGSKLVLCTRSLLICILWSAKMAVLDLLSKIIMKLPFERRLLNGFQAVLLLTFVASIVTVLVGCSPVSRHWQIYPNPGTCVIGNLWIYTYEISNIVTDILLMAVPFSLILSVKIPIMQRFRILLLFSIGLFLISISIIRILEGRGSRTQAGHTLWASLEVLFATIVAVTPTIYALAHNTREETTYGKSHVSLRDPGSRIRTGSVEDDDKYTARIWTELEGGSTREDNTSVTGILVRTDYVTANAKL